MSDTELQRIRLPYSCFLPSVPWVVMAPVAGLVIALGMKDPANWATAFRVGLIVGATVGAFVVPILVICALTYPVTIRASGVSSYNPYGTWKEESLSWQEMREVRPTRVLGVRYLRVESSRGAPLWIPSRALENGDFTAAVLRYSPSGGPLAQYLSTPA